MTKAAKAASQMFYELKARHSEEHSAGFVAIYQVKKDGNRYASPIDRVAPDQVSRRIEQLEQLNPGKKFVA